jgi:hypothetical protein
LLFISGLKREDFLNTSVEEECDMRVLLSLGNVDLVDALCAKSLCKYIAHVLWLEGDRERIVEFVLGHCSKSDVLGVGEVLQWRTVNVSKQLSDLSDTVGSVIEEKDLVTI